MFTGLVEAVGEIVERSAVDGGFRLRIATALARELTPGDSLAVNGVCLTVILSQDGEVHADIGPETNRVTTLGMLPQGAAVNLSGRFVLTAGSAGISSKATSMRSATSRRSTLTPTFTGSPSVFRGTSRYAIHGPGSPWTDQPTIAPGPEKFDIQIVLFTMGTRTQSRGQDVEPRM
jgi:hypothetical protein